MTNPNDPLSTYNSLKSNPSRSSRDVILRVEKHLAQKLCLNNRNDCGETLLMEACRHGLSSTVELLLEEGAYPHSKNLKSQTALHMCFDLQPDFYCLKSLIKANIDINAQDDEGKTALMHGVQLAMCITPIIDLALNFLIENGADLSLADHTGLNPAQLICQSTLSNRFTFLSSLRTTAQAHLDKQAIDDHIKIIQSDKPHVPVKISKL